MMHIDVFQALADPTRRRVVDALRRGERAVGDIVDEVDIDQSGVSRHLGILGKAGFVEVRPAGQRRLYSLCPEPFRELEAWLALYRNLWERRLDALGGARAKEGEETQGEREMTKTSRRQIRIERIYNASMEDVWEMWTTKDGIESWWGPEGFSVKVRRLDLRPGGELHYAMTATAPPQIEFMKKAGMALTTEARLTYAEVTPPERLAYTHLADFIPGVEPYEVAHVVELTTTGDRVRLVLTFDAMHDEEWTQRAATGWEMELGKLAKALTK